MTASGVTPETFERFDGQDEGSCHVSPLNTPDLNYSGVITGREMASR